MVKYNKKLIDNEEKKMKNSEFLQNQECEYFPCHKINDINKFNCLFCYCPLYMLKEKCGGNFKYTARGIKSCVNCVIPHMKDTGYKFIQEKMPIVRACTPKEKK